MNKEPWCPTHELTDVLESLITTLILGMGILVLASVVVSLSLAIYLMLCFVVGIPNLLF